MKYRVLDLFSGIGGFSLGLERTGGFETVAFCEIDPFARRVLAKHWPEVPCYDDVRTLTAERLASDGIGVDVICGGFPCQDISVAGSRQGIEGARSGLWAEIARLSGELRPRYLIVENVAALLGNGLGRVLGDLAEIGFDAEWHCIPASAVGAQHHRDRFWLVGYPHGKGQPDGPVRAGAVREGGVAYAHRKGFQGLHHEGWGKHLQPDESPLWRARRAAPRVRGRADGVPNWAHRLRCLGNAVVPQIPEMIGRAILAAEGMQFLEAAE